MDVNDVVNTWLIRGIGDLYFSFYIDDWVFDHQRAFSSIMGLEKHLKATVLYHRRNEFDSLPSEELKIEVNKIARKYGHDFNKLISDCNQYIGSDKLTGLIKRDYDSYNGEKLIEVLTKAYMDTRYPAVSSISLHFPLDQSNTIYHDPLSSSGLHKFIYAVCELLVNELAGHISLTKILLRIDDLYNQQVQFSRFKNVFLSNIWSSGSDL